MKRIDYEIFSMNNDGRYTKMLIMKKYYFIDGEKFGNRQASVIDMVYSSALKGHS